MMEKNAKIYVAGHRGMVGSAICRALESQGYHNLVKRTGKELDLRRQDLVEAFFEEEQPDGRILKHIKFRFPVHFNGKEIQEIGWDKETTVETVCCLHRVNS